MDPHIYITGTCNHSQQIPGRIFTCYGISASIYSAFLIKGLGVIRWTQTDIYKLFHYKTSTNPINIHCTLQALGGEVTRDRDEAPELRSDPSWGWAGWVFKVPGVVGLNHT